MKRSLSDIIKKNIEEHVFSEDNSLKKISSSKDGIHNKSSIDSDLCNYSSPFQKKRKSTKKRNTVPFLMSYDPGLNTPDRFREIVKNVVYSSGSKKLVDITAVNIMKAHGIQHILFISNKEFPLPNYWKDTGISFYKFPVEEETNLPTASQIKEIIAQVEMIFKENPEESILICNYSNSDNQYAVHIVATIISEKQRKKNMKNEGRIYELNRKNTNIAKKSMFCMSTYNKEDDDYSKKEFYSKRLSECLQAVFDTQQRMDNYL